MTLKTNLVLAISCAVFSASAFAGNSVVTNNRHQVTATIAHKQGTATSTTPVKPTLVFNNRHQVIGVVLKPSR